MACRGFWECLLRLLNFVIMLTGLAMVGYGIFLLVEWNRVSSNFVSGGGSVAENSELLSLGRPMLFVVDLSTSIVDQLPKAWFIYVFIGIGALLFVISCFGCIGVSSRSQCCLSFYSFMVILLILGELAAAAFTLFDQSWKDKIPTDQTGDFEMMYNFLKENWKIAKWVAMGAVILEGWAFLLSVLVRTAIEDDYDSDDEYLVPRPGINQPLINRQGAPSRNAPVLDNRPSRADAWTLRMREKYGIDTAEFSFNSADSSRFPHGTGNTTEEKSRCTIM